MNIKALSKISGIKEGFNLQFKGFDASLKSFTILNIEKIGSAIQTKSISSRSESNRAKSISSPAHFISIVDNFARAGQLDLIIEVSDESDIVFFEEWTEKKHSDERKTTISLKSKNDNSNFLVKLIRSWPTNIELINTETQGHSALRVTLYYEYLSLRLVSDGDNSTKRKISFDSPSTSDSTQIFKQGNMKQDLINRLNRKVFVDGGGSRVVQMSEKVIILLSPKYLIGKPNFSSYIKKVLLDDSDSKMRLATVNKIEMDKFTKKGGFNTRKLKTSQLEGVSDSLVMEFLVFNSSLNNKSLFNLNSKNTDISLNKLFFLSLAMTDKVSDEQKEKGKKPSNGIHYISMGGKAAAIKDNRMFKFFNFNNESPRWDSVLKGNLEWVDDTRGDHAKDLSPEIFAVPLDGGNHFYCKIRNYSISSKGFSKDGVPSYFNVKLVLEGVNLFNRYLTLSM